MVRPKLHLDSRDSSASFHAVTIHPGIRLGKKDYVRRTRSLNHINQSPERNSATILMGPPGSGRTTLARQWIAELDDPVQVIYARKPADIDLNAYSPPSPFGTALADLLNAVALRADEIDEDTIHQLLSLAFENSRQFPSRFVLDDLDILQLQPMERLTPLLGEAMAKYTRNQMLLISRTVSTQIMSGLRTASNTRLVAAQQLAFDETETISAHELGAFGNITLEAAEAARVANGGWISGMLNTRDGAISPIFSDDDFDNMVLNELLQPLPTSLQYVLTIAAHVPYLSKQVWDFITLEAGTSLKHGGMLIAQLPLVNNGESFELAVALRQSLSRLTNFIVEADRFRELIGQVLEWYARNDNLPAARDLAGDHNLEADYILLVKPLASEYARAERWQSIAALVDTLSLETITSDPDISFWYTYALTESDRWSDMIEIHYLVTQTWSESPSELIRGRNHLMKGWIARGTGDYQVALAEFEKAFHTLPKHAHQERMYASASAGTSVSQIQLGTKDVEWRRLTAFELTHLPPKQRWWHGNMGPLSFGYIASSGKLTEALQLAKQQVAALSESSPELRWRYLLLIAAIETERMRFDSAAEAIEMARPHIVSALQRNMTVVQESALLAARGDYRASMAHLDIEPYPAGRSVNNEFRFKLHSARQALDSGNTSAAQFLLDIAAWPVDPWPRNFGDPHPQLILARVRATTGKPQEGVTLAQEILKDAQFRRNRYLQICSHAVLAMTFHENSDHAQRDREIKAARTVDDGAVFQLAYHVNGLDVRTLDRSSTNLNRIDEAPAAIQNTKTIPSNTSVLTPREIEVISHVARGLPNRDVADVMFISLSTVKNHMANIFSKLGVSSRRVAVAKAKDMGILEP